VEETFVTGKMATVETDQVKRKAELTDADEEAETRAIREWLRTVDKPLASKIEKMTDHQEGYPVQGTPEEEVENGGTDTEGDCLQVPESTPKELLDLLAEIDREYFQDN